MTKRKAAPAAPWSRQKAGRQVLTRVASWADDYLDKLEAACHPKQLAAATDPHPMVAVLCPRGAGKTTSAEVRLLATMLRKKRARCVFVAVTKEHASSISWDKFKSIVAQLGVEATFAEVRRTITITKNGSTLQLAGADDHKEIDKLRGIPFDGAVIDEAASHSAKLLEKLIDRVLAPRMGERDGWIMMIGTPGHFLAGPFYDATRPGGPTHRPYAERELAKWTESPREWSSHHWDLEEAARYVPAAARLWSRAQQVKADKAWHDSNPVWMREYLGLWSADDSDMIYRYRPDDADGRPFNQWDPDRAGPLRLAKLPAEITDALSVITFDKGFTDNFAINVFSFSPTDTRRRIWHRYNFEAPGMFVRRFAVLLLGASDADPEVPREGDPPGGLIGALGGWPAAIVGDVDKGFLADLAGYGVPAAQADKNMASKATTIEEVNGDFVEGRIMVLKGSELEAQLQALQWVPDEFGAVKENKNQANHSTDCLVYARRVISPMFESASSAPKKAAPATARMEPPRQASRPSRSRFEPEEVRAPDWSELLASATYDDQW